MDLLAIFVVGVLQPFLLERSKDWKWFPFMDWIGRWSPILNRVTPAVLVLLSAAGITFQFDGETGVFTISGLIPGDIIRGIVLAVVGWITNQASYHTLVKR